MPEPLSQPVIWVEIPLALAIHHRQLAEHGGLDGVRDQGMLESALARPRNLAAYSEQTVGIHDLAAAYAFGLAKNHPFIDGNKRTAAVICETFIELNRHVLTASDQDMYVAIMALAQGSTSEQDFARWVNEHLKPIDPS